MRPPLPIARLDPPPEPEAFAAAHLAPDERTFRPVVLAGASPRATPEELAVLDPGAEVAIAILDDGDTFGPLPDGDAEFRLRRLPFAEALQLVARTGPGPRHYLRRLDLRCLPAVRERLREPRWVDRPTDEAAFAWIGQAGVVSPLHLDAANNFFCQVHGRKLVRLYAPDDSACCYPHRVAEVAHFSAVDAEAPDLAQHPRFAEATCYQAVLEPGDLLLLPAYWWHHVRSLDVGISISFMSKPAPWQHAARAKWMAAVASPALPEPGPRWDQRESARSKVR